MSLLLSRGFSAQSSSIPSISCNNNALPMTSKNSSVSSMGQATISSTSSSSPMISVPTSPDNDNSSIGNSSTTTPKKSSPSSEDSGENSEPTAAKVLSGIFETFDNLLWKKFKNKLVYLGWDVKKNTTKIIIINISYWYMCKLNG